MSTFIDNAFVTKYQDDFHVVAQQKKSRLEQFARKKVSVTGASFTTDILGTATGYSNRARHSDLQYENLENTRRVCYMLDHTAADLVDEEDKLKTLINPTNRYTEALTMSCKRFYDQKIVDAALGSAQTLSGNTTFGTQALPAAQKIAVGGTGLTLAKLRQAKKLLDKAEMDDSDYFQSMGTQQSKQDAFGNLNAPSYVLVCSADEIDGLLSVTEVVNSDYASIKALVAGTANTFMGFLFVRLGEGFLPEVGTTRSCFAYAPRAMEYGIGKEPSSRLDYIPQKKAWQVMADCSMNAVRAEDTGVVQIDVLIP